MRLSLTQGTIELNAAKLAAKVNKEFGSAVISTSTCSVGITASSAVSVVGGTGLYAGVSGSVHVTLSVGFTQPRLTTGAHAGQCNTSNAAQPTAALQVVDGTGTVHFS